MQLLKTLGFGNGGAETEIGWSGSWLVGWDDVFI